MWFVLHDLNELAEFRKIVRGGAINYIWHILIAVSLSNVHCDQRTQQFATDESCMRICCFHRNSSVYSAQYVTLEDVAGRHAHYCCMHAWLVNKRKTFKLTSSRSRWSEYDKLVATSVVFYVKIVPKSLAAGALHASDPLGELTTP